MSNWIDGADLADAKRIARLADAVAGGLPARSLGADVPGPSTWDGTGSTPVGWTEHHYVEQRTSSPDVYAVKVDYTTAALLTSMGETVSTGSYWYAISTDQNDPVSSPSATVSGTGDGVTNDRDGIYNALTSVATGGKVELPDGTWYCGSNCTVDTFTGDVYLTGDGALKIPSGVTLSLSPDSTTYTQTSDQVAGDTTIDVSDATGINVGDVIRIATSVIAETGWSTPGYEISTVAGVAGNTITLSDPLSFDHLAVNNTVFRVYRQARIKIDIPRCDSEQGLTLIGWAGVDISRMTAYGPASTFAGLGSLDGSNCGIRLYFCTNAHVSHSTINGFMYGILPNGCRKVRVYDLSCERIRHPVAPTAWTNDVVVRKLRAGDVIGITDAHPTFNVRYIDVTQTTAPSESDPASTDFYNLRPVGGSISDLTIPDGNVRDTLMHTLGLVDSTPYTTADFELLRVNTPSAKTGPTRGRYFTMTDCNVYDVQCGTLNKPVTATVANTVARSMRFRQPTTLDGCTITGDHDSHGWGLDYYWCSSFDASNLTVSGVVNVIYDDASGTKTRTFTDCTFSCSGSFSEGTPLHTAWANHTFTRCDFTGVASFPPNMTWATFIDCVGEPT